MNKLDERRIKVIALREALADLYSESKLITDDCKFKGLILAINLITKRIDKLEKGETE